MTPAALRCLRANLATAIHQSWCGCGRDDKNVASDWASASAVLAVLERQGIINNEGEKP